MILLNPFALLWALLISLIVLLHFRRPRSVRYISNLHLWQTPGDESDDKRLIIKRIRKNWRLILQILFLGCVILALARPSMLFGNKSRTIVFVIDCSVSMGARERGVTRLDLVRAKILRLLDEVGGKDRVLMVQGRPQPVLNYYSGSDQGALRRALNSLTATEPSADIDQALAMGLAFVGNPESYEAFVFSDGTQEFHLPGNNGNNDRIHYVQVGASDNNVAITRLSIRSNPFSPYDREAYAEVANLSDRIQKFRFDMALEGVSLISETVELGSRQRKSFAVKTPPAGRGMVKASIDIQDDLDGDNRATASLDLGKISVLLATDGNHYLEKALRVNPRIACATKKPEACSQEELKRYDVVILDGVGMRQLPPANYFMIEYPAADTSVIGKDLVSPMPGHSIMSFVNLRNVVIESALPLRARSSETILIEEKGKALMVASETGAYRTVRLGCDVRSSNLPLTLSFPVLVSNIINWLGSRTDDSIRSYNEQESNIKPVFRPQNRDARFSERPVLANAGWEIYRALLFVSLALLMLGFLFV